MASKKGKISDITHRIENFKDSVSDAKDKTEDIVRKNPWQSVAVAAAVGAVIGLAAGIIMRRDNSPRLVRKLRDYLE